MKPTLREYTSQAESQGYAPIHCQLSFTKVIYKHVGNRAKVIFQSCLKVLLLNAIRNHLWVSDAIHRQHALMLHVPHLHSIRRKNKGMNQERVQRSSRSLKRYEQRQHYLCLILTYRHDKTKQSIKKKCERAGYDGKKFLRRKKCWNITDFAHKRNRKPIKILYRRFKNHPKILFVSFPSQIYFARIHVYFSYSAFDLHKHIIQLTQRFAQRFVMHRDLICVQNIFNICM